MTKIGRIVTTKVSGEKLKHLQTAEQTNGMLTQFELLPISVFSSP